MGGESATSPSLLRRRRQMGERAYEHVHTHRHNYLCTAACSRARVVPLLSAER